MYLFFDTETNGFPPKARMTQIAFMLCDENGEILEQYESLIKPDGWVVPKEKFFIENGHSTERCEEYGVPVFDALRRFQDALKLSKYKIAHNIKFDNQIIQNELVKASITHQLFQFKKSHCTMLSNVEYVQAINKWGKPGKWPTLIELHNKIFKCDFQGAHDAMYDVTAMKNCFFELKKMGMVGI